MRGYERAALARIYLSRLPVLTECLGQARALGASVAARGACSAVARVRLMFLIARAEVVLGQAVTVCAGMPEGERASAAVVEMARVVRERLLVSVDNAKLRRQVRPNEKVRLEVENTKVSSRAIKQHGKAFVGDELAAEADFMCVLGPDK